MKRICRMVTFILAVAICFAAAGQSRVAFDDIALGRDAKSFAAALKAKGFHKVVREDPEKHPFYGMVSKTFFLGKWHGEPTSVRITESLESGLVYCVDVQLREFVDNDEAMELLNVILAEDAGRYPRFEREDRPPSMPLLVDMPNWDKHITRYVCFPEAYCFFRFYPEAGDDQLGYADYTTCSATIGSEYIINIHYYDARSGEEVSR